MGVVIGSEIWEPNQALYIFIFVSCFISISFLPHSSMSSNRTPTPFDHSLSSPRFRRSFLLVYCLSSVMEGLWSVSGEYELVYYGVSKDQMVCSLCVGYLAALILGSSFGMLSDLIGLKKACLIFCFLHLFVATWKRIFAHPTVWIASICLSLASSIFSFSFETWMVLEHNKLGHRQDILNDMYWLMTFSESASSIVSQVLANFLVGRNVVKHINSPSNAALLLATVTIIFVTRGWKEVPQAASFQNYRMSFYEYIFGG